MKISFLKSKIRALKKYDLIKALIDILLPEIRDIGDYNPKMSYKKGDKVYYYDKFNDKSHIIEATEDITPTDNINLNQWSVVSGGNGLPNANLIKKIKLNTNNNLMYEDSVLNNVHVSTEEPKMNEGDLWFTMSQSDAVIPPTRETEVIIKNMVVQDTEPANKNDLWGHTES